MGSQAPSGEEMTSMYIRMTGDNMLESRSEGHVVILVFRRIVSRKRMNLCAGQG
jgi:hypothetical protein